MKKFKGVFIREVWDFRLSKAAPMLYNNGDTWIVKLHCNATGDVLEEHDTGISAVKDGVCDNWDREGINACYVWLYSVRDNYSRGHLKERKPVVKMINEANSKSSAINSEMLAAEAESNTDLANQKRGEMQQHLVKANAGIRVATDEMVKKIRGAA